MHDDLKKICRPGRTRRVWSVWNDLFHENVPDEFIEDVLQCMKCAYYDVFLICTKRGRRLLEWFRDWWGFESPGDNIFFAITGENQARLESRLEFVLELKARTGIKTFLSIEPCLGSIDLSGDDGGHHCFSYEAETGEQVPALFDGVILGGETGPKARPMHPDWPRKVRDDCLAAGVPFFFKQWGEWIHNPHMHSMPWDKRFKRVGRKVTGRLLDGREWNELPW